MKLKDAGDFQRAHNAKIKEMDGARACLLREYIHLECSLKMLYSHSFLMPILWDDKKIENATMGAIMQKLTSQDILKNKVINSIIELAIQRRNKLLHYHTKESRGAELAEQLVHHAKTLLPEEVLPGGVLNRPKLLEDMLLRFVSIYLMETVEDLRKYHFNATEPMTFIDRWRLFYEGEESRLERATLQFCEFARDVQVVEDQE